MLITAVTLDMDIDKIMNVVYRIKGSFLHDFEEIRAQLTLDNFNYCFERLWNAIQMICAPDILSDYRSRAWRYVPPAVQRHNSPLWRQWFAHS